jgi:hypothetical protein
MEPELRKTVARPCSPKPRKSFERLRREYRFQLSLSRPIQDTTTTLSEFAHSSQLARALTKLEKAKLERSDDTYVIYSVGIIAAARGYRPDALKKIKRLEQMSGSNREGTLLIAMLYCALNEKESALSWLERGLEAGAITIFYKNDPVWDPIRNEPRFDNLIQRMAIPKVAIRFGFLHERSRNEWTPQFCKSA